jgi:hypothetical protein
MTADGFNLLIGNTELPGKEKDQVLIGGAIDGRRGDTYFETIPMDDGVIELCSGIAAGARLDGEL